MMPTCSDLKDVQGFDVCHIQARKNIVSVTLGFGVILKNTQLERRKSVCVLITWLLGTHQHQVALPVVAVELSDTAGEHLVPGQ